MNFFRKLNNTNKVEKVSLEKKIKKFLLKYKYEILIILLTLIIYLTHISRFYKEDIALKADGYYYYQTLLSIVKDHDIVVSNNIFNGVFEYNYDIHHSPFSVGKNGKIYPKHPVILAFTAIPFYFIFRFNNDGETAVLIYMIFNMVFLHLIIYKYLKEYFNNKTAILVLMIILLAGPVSRTITFSMDILTSLFIFGGLYLLRKKRLFIAGILLGFSVWCRLSNIIFILSLLLFLFNKDMRKKIIITVIFSIIPLFLFGLYNNYYYGSFYTTSYDRVLCHINGKITIEKHSELINKDIPKAFKDIFIKKSKSEDFFDMHNSDGLIYLYPLWFLIIPGLMLFARKDRYMSIYIILNFILILCFYTVYGMFQVRYIYPLLCFFNFPLGCIIEKIINLTDSSEREN